MQNPSNFITSMMKLKRQVFYLLKQVPPTFKEHRTVNQIDQRPVWEIVGGITSGRKVPCTIFMNKKNTAITELQTQSFNRLTSLIKLQFKDTLFQTNNQIIIMRTNTFPKFKTFTSLLTKITTWQADCITAGPNDSKRKEKNSKRNIKREANARYSCLWEVGGAKIRRKKEGWTNT
jgi:hypothetical protein